MLSRQPGRLNWYNIVRQFDILDAEQIPPPFFVLQDLKKQGYVESDPPEGGNRATYSLTTKGIALLEQLPEDS